MSVITQSAITNALYSYCFERVWNVPISKYAVNLRLIPISSRFVVNYIIDAYYLNLPAKNTQYAAYQLDAPLFGDTWVMPSNTWVTSDQVGSVYDTLLNVYTETGLMFPKASVALYRHTNMNKIFIIITEPAVLKTGGLAEWSSLYLSIYRYTKTSHPLTIQSFIIPSSDVGLIVTNQAQNALAASLAVSFVGTTVYVNGYDLNLTQGMVFLPQPGDMIDILTDTTVVGSYSVDLTTTQTGYFSLTYGVYKEVLHCPRALNPNNQILTTESLSLTARRNSDQVGVYIHRNDINALTQITHNDVGLNTTIVDAYRTSLASQDISIDVKVRLHPNVLVREIDYISDLYLCSDATILSFLIGLGDAALPFWAAVALESSFYVTALSILPRGIVREALSTYMTGLGYYTTLAVLSQQIVSIPVLEIPISAITVSKPFILKGSVAYPRVYLNGLKLQDAQVVGVNTADDRVQVSMTNTVPWQIGQIMTIELIEAGISIPYLFTPTAAAPSITVPFASVTVFQKNILVTPVTAYGASASSSYTPITLIVGGMVQIFAASGGGMQITFTPQAYNTSFVIQNETFSRCYAQNITATVAATAPIHLELMTVANDGVTILPLVGVTALDVYLNGARLIHGIDYAAVPYTDISGNLAIFQVMICNREFLNFMPGAANYLEVIARTATTLADDIGYVVNNVLSVGNAVELYYAGMSQVFANGALQTNVTDNGTTLSPTPAIANACAFAVQTRLPNFFTTLLSGYTSTLDDQRLAAINVYFNAQTTPSPTAPLVIVQSWTVFSPYLTAIIYDATQQPGNITLYANDPDVTLFKAQFSAYNEILQNDPTLNATGSLIDLRFCDVYPVYQQVIVPNTQLYTVLRRLAALMLTPDSDTLGEILQ